MSTATNIVRMPNKTQEPDDVILTLEETADFLKVKKRTLYDLVQRRKIPFLRVGKFLRFSKQALLAWMKEQAES